MNYLFGSILFMFVSVMDSPVTRVLIICALLALIELLQDI